MVPAVIREIGPLDDAEPILDLAARVEEETGVPPFGESKFVDLTIHRRGRGFGLGTDGLRAYLHLLEHTASGAWEMELVAERDVDALDLAALVTAAAHAAGAGLLWWTFGESVVSRFAAGEFSVVRQLHKLTGAVPPTEKSRLPAGIEIRPFRPGRDEEVWLDANNAAFSGHAENGSWTRADIEERQTRPWFDAEGFRLAWMGERLAGFCWTKRHSESVGEIHVIGVHPAFQRAGIGRAIVIEALWYLAGTGCSTGMLYVDTANRSALRLYQSLGFTVERVDVCFGVPKGWPHEAQ